MKSGQITKWTYILMIAALAVNVVAMAVNTVMANWSTRSQKALFFIVLFIYIEVVLLRLFC